MSERENQLPEEMDELQLLFSSRGRGHGLSPEDEQDSTSQWLIELLALRRTGALSLRYTTIPRVSLEPSMPNGLTGYEWQMRSVAYRRPGNAELSDLLWSGYSWLQGENPGTELMLSRQPPHLYHEPVEGLAITAGDLPVERVVKEVVALPLTTLGIVALAGTWCRKPIADPASFCDLVLLTFQPEAREALQESLEARRQRFIEKFQVSRSQLSASHPVQETSRYVEELLRNVARKGRKP